MVFIGLFACFSRNGETRHVSENSTFRIFPILRKWLIFGLIRPLLVFFAYSRQHHRGSKISMKTGARGGGRTHNLQLRRLTLYPIELRAQILKTNDLIESQTKQNFGLLA